MKKWFIQVLILGSVLMVCMLSAQETIPDGEGPGRRARLADFNALGNEDPVEQYLASENWLANLNPSANYNRNKMLTYTKNAKNQTGDKNFLGVRVHFPSFTNNAYATINPPLPFPFYGGTEDENLLGVISNVGAIKSIIARVAGRNFHHKVFANVQRSDGEVMFAPLGGLEFLGWRDLQYDNPYYIESVKNKHLSIKPAYPRILPSVRFKDIIFFKNGESPLVGDFVTYVAWVDLIYDFAFSEIELNDLRESEDYIEDDEVWKILSGEIGKVQSTLFEEKLNRFRYLEGLERDKMNLPPLRNAAPAAAPQ